SWEWEHLGFMARAAERGLHVLISYGHSPRYAALFPYTTLFRSDGAVRAAAGCRIISCPRNAVLDNDAASRKPATVTAPNPISSRSEEHTSELQSQSNLVCRLLLEKKKGVFVVSG